MAALYASFVKGDVPSVVAGMDPKIECGQRLRAGRFTAARWWVPKRSLTECSCDSGRLATISPSISLS